jgi:pyruvate/2-oxoglutarate dehydrogenase complex dihydrolipoamide dehydrogenase (E3) component
MTATSTPAASGYDLVVLGAGATGLAAARRARRDGRRVALVEAARPGGDCTHFGCVPSKTLLETARRVQAARSGPAYGFTAPVEVDFPAVMTRVQAVVAEIEQDESPELLAGEGIDLLQGWGTLTGPTTLDVHAEGATRHLTAARFVLATGSRSALPPVEGLSGVDHLDNRSVFSLTELPDHLVVLGGGPIGVELAQAFRRLGSRVTLVEAAPTVLGKEEPEAQQALTGVLRREGVDVRTGTEVERVETSPAGPLLQLSDGSALACTHLLVAVGRQPSTQGLGLDRAGVRVDERGRVLTDAHLRASETVWAAGDCTSPLQFTHVGDEQGRLAAANAVASSRVGRKAWDDRVVPWVTFTEPEVARVGLSEEQAVAAYGDRVRVATYEDRRSDRGRTAGVTDGFVKLVAVRGRVGGMALGRLVGMTVVGPMAGEQIAQGALAMRSGMLVGRLAQTLAAYPTWSLSTRIAAARLFGSYGGKPARSGRATS